MTMLAVARVDEWEIVARLAAAAGLAGCIGLQREFAGHDAGTRTHALLALGAALFGVLSVGAFNRYVTERAATNIQIDITRIASYVAAGVGFIAGGVIVKHHDRVKGLTTASSLWVAAAVGLAAGLGAFLGALAATAITIVFLAVAGPLERFTRRGQARTVMTIVTTGDPSDVVHLLRQRAGPGPDGAAMSFHKQPPRTTVIVRGIAAATARELAIELVAREDVEECDVDTG